MQNIRGKMFEISQKFHRRDSRHSKVRKKQKTSKPPDDLFFTPSCQLPYPASVAHISKLACASLVFSFSKFLLSLLIVCRQRKLKESPQTRGGGTRMSRGYQARPKNHVIRVVFQDQALYARTSFRGAKTCKIGKKGVFLVIQTNFGKNIDRQIKKNVCKNVYLGSIFIPEKYVIRVLFVSPWTSLIPPLAIRVAPRGPQISTPTAAPGSTKNVWRVGTTKHQPTIQPKRASQKVL